MEKPRPSTVAVGAIVGSALIYDVFAPHGETFSERFDPLIEQGGWKRAATRLAIGVTACHLANLIPERADPFHYALLWKKVKEELTDE